ncbi:MAG TPA: cytochrome c oxidase subunit II [Microvirga sp.]|jgi:cytochrome c oxidase subunit 2|nr:cytochrome c oxidase subunit II [Microvirga sp.]
MRIVTHSRSALALAGALIALAFGSGAAMAGTGQPTPWQMDFQGMVTENGLFVAAFHYWLVILITAISLFVLGLLVYIVYRFNERSNPTPSKTTHNTMLEVAWTVVPVLILIAIAIPSFRVLREQLVIPKHDLVVKATGYAWYWGYEYPQDQGGFRFDSNMVDEKDLKPGQPRLLTVDNEMVVPVNKVVRLQVTAGDVMHNFAVPSLGQKLDAIPGRLNETWFKADREGVFYGQCSELCGNGHPYMPITVRVVSEQAYAAWVAEAKTKFARIDGTAPTKLANAQ